MVTQTILRRSLAFAYRFSPFLELLKFKTRNSKPIQKKQRRKHSDWQFSIRPAVPEFDHGVPAQIVANGVFKSNDSNWWLKLDLNVGCDWIFSREPISMAPGILSLRSGLPAA